MHRVIVFEVELDLLISNLEDGERAVLGGETTELLISLLTPCSSTCSSNPGALDELVNSASLQLDIVIGVKEVEVSFKLAAVRLSSHRYSTWKTTSKILFMCTYYIS